MGLALTGVLAYGLERSVKAAMDAQVSTARLDAGFKAAGLTATKYSGQIAGAESAGRKLGFSNTDVRDSLGSLVVATKSGTKSIQELAGAENLARLRHVDLATATKAMTMAQAGSTRAIKQLGITIVPVTTAMDQLKLSHMKTGTAAYFSAEAAAKAADKNATLAEVLGKVNAATHGQAKAFADTAAGGMAQFHAQTTALMESLGKALLPALTTVSAALATFAGYLAANPALAKIVVAGLGGLAIALIAVSVAAMGTAAALTLGIGAAVIAVAAGVTLMITHWHEVKAAMNEVMEWVRTHWVLIGTLIAGPIGFAVAEVATHWKTIRDDAVTAWDGIKSFFQKTVHEIAGLFTSLPGDIVDAIRGAFGDLEKGIKDLFSWHKIVGWIKDALGFGSPSPHFMAIGHDMIESIIHGAGAAAGLLKNAVERIAMDVLSSIPGSSTAHPSPRGGGPQPGAGGSNIAIGQRMAAGYGWGSGAQWDALNAVVMRESGWSNTVWGSGVHTVRDLGGAEAAYGIAQAKPADKYPLAGQPQGGSSPSAQIGWMLNYIKGRYGNPSGALAHEHAFGWYGKGGIFTQPTIIGVGERGPEAVVPLSRGGMGGSVTVNLHVGGSVVTEGELIEKVRREFYRVQKRNSTLGFR